MSGNLNLQPGEALLVEGVVAYIGGNVDSNGKYHSLRRVEGDEIVRCRDCVHFEPNGPIPGCTLFDFGASDQDEKGFCAWGERTADGD